MAAPRQGSPLGSSATSDDIRHRDTFLEGARPDASSGAAAPFDPDLRARREERFEVGATSSGPGYVTLEIGGRRLRAYSNANLSIYSGERCNARCPFCVEELRPLSRGVALAGQKVVLGDDARYFAGLERVLETLRPLDPSVSITGGEPSRDPRLPRILETLRRAGARKRTMTTNASGLLEPLPEGGDVLDAVLAGGLRHLNLSRADPDEAVNQRIMRIEPAHSNHDLACVIERCRAFGGPRVRLSCVLLRERTDDVEGCARYLGWAAELGVDNVVFRQLMKFDAATHRTNVVTRFSEAHRASLRPILERILSSGGAPGDSRFRFVKQVVGYYYYVEVYRYVGAARPIDVVFEEADLASIERRKRLPGEDDVVHELVFHPDGRLASTWQPWDGVLLEGCE